MVTRRNPCPGGSFPVFLRDKHKAACDPAKQPFDSHEAPALPGRHVVMEIEPMNGVDDLARSSKPCGQAADGRGYRTVGVDDDELLFSNEPVKLQECCEIEYWIKTPSEGDLVHGEPRC